MKTFLSDPWMKKGNILPFLSMIIFSFVLMNCGKSKSGAVLKPETTKIQGVLGEYYEVIDKDYKIADDEGIFHVLSVTLKRKSDGLPFDPSQAVPYGTNHARKDTHVGFGIELMDEDGNVVEVIQATASGMGGVYSVDDITSLINLQKGETATVRWSIDKKLLSKIKSFRITSAMEKDEAISNLNAALGDTIEDVTEDMGYADDHSNIDQLLDSYERYLNEYIRLTQNAQSGSVPGTIDSYTDLINKQADLSVQLNNNKGTMNPQQIARLTQIQAKAMSAIGYQ